MGIEVRAISLGDMDLPKELNDEIAARDQALAEQETNRRLVERYKQEQALKAQEALRIGMTAGDFGASIIPCSFQKHTSAPLTPKKRQQ